MRTLLLMSLVACGAPGTSSDYEVEAVVDDRQCNCHNLGNIIDEFECEPPLGSSPKQCSDCINGQCCYWRQLTAAELLGAVP